MKKLITNVSKDKLTFPSLDFTIDTNEIKKVTEEQFSVLINNFWIREIIKPKKEEKKQEEKKKVDKSLSN